MFDSWFKASNKGNENRTIIQNKAVENVAIPNKLLLLSTEMNNYNSVSKVSPTVKATSVNVTIEDNVNNNSHSIDVAAMSEPTVIPNQEQSYRSASISLSIELAKKSSIPSINTKNYMQKPDSIMTPQSSLSKSIVYHPHYPSSAQSSTNSLLQRMAHSPKAAPATFPTSVSASGNVVFEPNNEDKEESSEEEIPQEAKSPAIKSLTKRIHHYSPNAASQVVTQHNMDELTEDEIMNPAPTISTTPTVSITNTDDEDEKSILSDQMNQQTGHTTQYQVHTNVKAEIINPHSPTCENSASLQSSLVLQSQGDGNSHGFWSWLGFFGSETSSTMTKPDGTKDTSAASIPPQTTNVNTDTTTMAIPTRDISENSLSQHTMNAKTEVDSIKTTTTKDLSASSIPQHLMNVKTDTTSPSTTTTTTTIATATKTTSEPESVLSSSSSWMSFLFPSSKPTLTTTIGEPVQQIIEQEDNSIRKVKSTSSLPSSKPDVVLRNSASISSLNNIVRKKNHVLPPFHSQFSLDASDSPVSPPPTNILTKAMDAINAILIPSPDPPEDTSNWIAKRMRTKFANFIEELKSSADPTKKAMMEKRIVIVGVHGWFPMKLVRSMIGEPTGTSIKFCEQMASAVRLYFETEHQVTLPNDAITLVPLEGEGKVEDRVNHLYAKLLENSEWLEAVSSADVVLWATHSQGTPVSMILLQRLLERGHIHIIRQSVCVLAMAGISHGPFPALKGSLIVKYFEADPARELFEFMDSTSSISVKYRQSLAYILKCGIKVVLMGSMQDQVVPLYSAIMSYVNHPNLLRSVYIDGHIYSDNDFLINLVVFALKLRNTGLSDHHLLTHLSEVLAGSLYALEGGHSTIYEEIEVYMTAIRYTFETAPFGKWTQNIYTNQPTSPSISRKQSAASSSLMAHMTSVTADIVEAQMEPFQAKLQQNPFYLPWALHGIFCDPQILADEALKTELKRLRLLFDHWNPTSGRLKELKFRLDPLKTVKL